MPKKPFRVGRSRTGLGLFATEPIKKKTAIVRYTGTRITQEEAVRRENRGAKYLFEINTRWVIDGASRRNVARYANHSCRPNAEANIIKGKIILKSIKNIKPGDEITYDYGRNYFKHILMPIGCRCVKCHTAKRKDPR
jgi:uncharacterized protein